MIPEVAAIPLVPTDEKMMLFMTYSLPTVNST
jgi:hypothetical protein